MKKIPFVPIILGIITIAELIVAGYMGGSVTLWMFYGGYKFLKA